MEIKLSGVQRNDLLNTLIISGGNVCKMSVMTVVLLDVGMKEQPGWNMVRYEANNVHR